MSNTFVSFDNSQFKAYLMTMLLSERNVGNGHPDTIKRDVEIANQVIDEVLKKV